MKSTRTVHQSISQGEGNFSNKAPDWKLFVVVLALKKIVFVLHKQSRTHSLPGWNSSDQLTQRIRAEQRRERVGKIKLSTVISLRAS